MVYVIRGDEKAVEIRKQYLLGETRKHILDESVRYLSLEHDPEIAEAFFRLDDLLLKKSMELRERLRALIEISDMTKNFTHPLGKIS